LPHSKTLRDELECAKVRQVLECGSPLPLLDFMAPLVAVSRCALSKKSLCAPARRISSFIIRCFLLGVLLAVIEPSLSAQVDPVFPGEHWEMRQPESLGLSKAKLEALREVVGGRGCVVRYGYMAYSWGDPARSADVASAVKPVISTLLLFAVQEGRVTSVDAAVSEFEPRLKTLNQGKDASITWRHFASQTSGYGLAEPPGRAYAYNDLALALYCDTLTQKVFGTNGTEALRIRLAEPLQFEDHYSFSPFRRPNRDGRLAISTRDFARFGLLYLRGGNWR